MTTRNRYILGKIDYNNSGRKNCEAVIEWELKNGKFSMSAQIWNPKKTDIYAGGQCVDEVAAYFPENKIAQRMVEVWQEWHLNDLTAGSPKQEAAVKQWRINNNNHQWAYNEICEYLKSIDLLVDKSFLHNSKPYSYGSAWLKTEIPLEIQNEVKSWSYIGKASQGDTVDEWDKYINEAFEIEAIWQDENQHADIYSIKIKNKKDPKKILRTEYTQGKGHRLNGFGKPFNQKQASNSWNIVYSGYSFNKIKSKPSLKAVFAALASDAQAYNENRDFLDFAENFGYDDKREARRVWQACEKMYYDLQALTGNAFGEFLSE